MHNNKNISQSTDRYVQFERIYKKIKHICVGFFCCIFHNWNRIDFSISDILPSFN